MVKGGLDVCGFDTDRKRLSNLSSSPVCKIQRRAALVHWSTGVRPLASSVQRCPHQRRMSRSFSFRPAARPRQKIRHV